MANNTVKIQKNEPKKAIWQISRNISTAISSFKLLKTTSFKSNVGPFQTPVYKHIKASLSHLEGAIMHWETSGLRNRGNWRRIYEISIWRKSEESSLYFQRSVLFGRILPIFKLFYIKPKFQYISATVEKAHMECKNLF